MKCSICRTPVDVPYEVHVHQGRRTQVLYVCERCLYEGTDVWDMVRSTD